MRPWFAVFALAALCVAPLQAAPLPSAARTVIPAEVQQVISLDQRALRDSQAAQAAQSRFVPPYLKQFEDGLKAIGIDPAQDVEQVVFVVYRGQDNLRMFAVAQGTFSAAQVTARAVAQKLKPAKVRASVLYPMNGGLQFTFLDAGTILFGDTTAVRRALDSRDNAKPSLALQRESHLHSLMASAEAAPVWSVLDAHGAQHLLRGALGAGAEVADYAAVRNRLLGARYSLSFGPAVAFDFILLTPDATSAATLSSVVKAGLLLRRVNARPEERLAMENMVVESDNTAVALRFRAPESRFRALLDSELIAAVTR